MRRIILIAAISLLISCTSLHIGGYSDSEKRDALTHLGNDMISYAENTPLIERSVFSSALPPSYTAYEAFYSAALSEIISPLLSDLYKLEEESLGEAVSYDMDTSISEAEGLTDKLQSITARDAYNMMISALEGEEDALFAAFSPSDEAFSSIKASYDNLRSVGLDSSFPEPEGFTIDELGFIVTDYFFTDLGAAERHFKSQLPENADPIYRIFWEDTL